ncbi:MAG: endo alpha-1,4 polygalactosaminidase [Cetobacterium sp.]
MNLKFFKKNKAQLLCSWLILSSMLYSSEESKLEMRELVKQIRNQSKESIIITQNGSNIFFDNEAINKNFVDIVDGVSQESLFYGVGGLNKMTPLEERDYLLKNLLELKRSGKVILSVNYADNKKIKFEVKKLIKKYGFLGEVVPAYEANKIFSPLNKSSKKDIENLKDAENFLYLLNPEKFKNIEDYVRVLKNTDFDLLIIEPSLNGKFMTKEQIEELKIGKNNKRRLVLAYFSIGEAENYRYYWEKSWNKELPKWIVKENPNWKGNYIIKYWDSEWKKIVNDYQKKLDAIGIDGYYLDTIDTFEQF